MTAPRRQPAALRTPASVILSLWVLAAAGLVASMAAAAPAELSLGVAPFESQAAPGAAVPDVATLLADRLGTRGIAKVVGPARLGAPPDIDLPPDRVQHWAQEAAVDAVVLGRSTRVGDALSVEVRLLSGASGEPIHSYTQEIPSPAELEPSLDELVSQIVAAVEDVPTAKAPKPSGSTGFGLGESDSPFGFQKWNSGDPLKINSDQLEAVQKDGIRTLVFKKNVHVQQGDLSIRCSLLEAFYPKDGSQPDRLVARGRVRMVQAAADQSASCDLAIYDRIRDRFTCKGNASFRDGNNTLRGTEIDVDLKRETVEVRGGAELLIHPDSLGKSGS
jgi:lipopolysaccharide transport protein LptA